MKIINTFKYSIKFNEQYDWFSDDTNKDLINYQSNKDNDFEIVNWEANEEINEDDFINNDKEELSVVNIDEDDESVGGLLADDNIDSDIIPEQNIVDEKYPIEKHDDRECEKCYQERGQAGVKFYKK